MQDQARTAFGPRHYIWRQGIKKPAVATGRVMGELKLSLVNH